MRPVKSRARPDTAAESRLREVAVSIGLGKEQPQAWLADRAGIPRSTLKNAAARNSLTYEVARSIAKLMVGEEKVLVSWLMGETPERPDRAAMAPRMPQDETSGPAGITAGPRSPRLLDMLAAAKKIAIALQQDLESSEIPTNVTLDGASAKGRQQALVWALKDLARQLMHLGFDSHRLLALTDDMAREIGLPVRKPEP